MLRRLHPSTIISFYYGMVPVLSNRIHFCIIRTSTYYVYFNMIEQTYLSSSIDVIICIMHDIHSFIGTVRYEGFEISDVQFCKMKLDISIKWFLNVSNIKNFLASVQYDIRYIRTYRRNCIETWRKATNTYVRKYVRTVL